MKPIRRKAATAGALAVLALGGTLAATAPASAATMRRLQRGVRRGVRGLHVDSGDVLAADRRRHHLRGLQLRRPAVVCRDRAQQARRPRLHGGHPGHLADQYRPGPRRLPYTAFAGPVYKDLPEPGRCMTWSGSIDLYYNSDRGLCP